MNLEESDLFKEELERNGRSRKRVLISIIFCGVLIALLVVLIRIIIYEDSITLKMFLNDKQIQIPKGLYIEKDNEIYLNVKEVGSLLGYNYTKGVYGEYNENEDSCYLQNDFEIVAITAGADKYKKYIEVGEKVQIGEFPIVSKNPNGYSETFNIEKPIILENGIIYAPKDYVMEMFNMQIEWEQYRIKFYSIEYIIEMAKQVVQKAGLIEVSGYYENIRALNYGFIVVGNATQEKEASTAYGVITMNGDDLISKKYDSISFIQNTREFYVTAADGTVGILNKEGGFVITPSEYEEISLLDQEQKLYLVRQGAEYGVLNGNGKTIVHPEQDSIGIDVESFSSEEIENNALFYEKCIPFEKDGKFGLYNIEGQLVLEPVYNAFGYKTNSKITSSGSEQSALLIPSYVGINGIVVNYNDSFGIYDVNAGLTVPTVFEKIYSITQNGQTTYYAQYDGERMDLAEYLKESNLNTVNEAGELLSEIQAEDKSNKQQENVEEINNEDETNLNEDISEETTEE